MDAQTTSTELGCAKCGEKILPFAPFITDGENFYHEACGAGRASPATGTVHALNVEDSINISKDGAA